MLSFKRIKDLKSKGCSRSLTVLTFTAESKQLSPTPDVRAESSIAHSIKFFPTAE